MRVGFITQLLWQRYGSYWERILTDAGAEAAFAAPERALAAAGDPRLEQIPGVAFRLAAAQALALQDVDLLLAPDLNDGAESPRGGGQDAWVAAFPTALAGVGGLPPVLGVPARLGDDLETAVVGALHRVTRDPRLVKRLWDRHRAPLKGATPGEARLPRTPAQGSTIGIVGQPWLVRDELVALVTGEGEHPVGQHRLAPELLRSEGAQAEAGLLPTDSEVLGAARLFARRGAIAEVRMIADRTSGTDAWLLNRVGRLVRKPFTVHYLQDLLPAAELAGVLLGHDDPSRERRAPAPGRDAADHP